MTPGEQDFGNQDSDARSMPPSGVSIPATDAMRLVAAHDVWLLDVREHFEWAAGHAPQAHHIPMGDLGLRQGELPDDETIAVMCHIGARSRMVTDALVDADYRAIDVSGGIVAWQASGGEVVVDGDVHGPSAEPR